MQLKIADSIVQGYPSLRIGFVVARGIDNQGPAPQLDEELRAAEADFRTRFANEAALDQDARIQAWRETYQSFKVNPKRFRPSAEALLRRVVKGDPVRWISKAVNAYLLAELAVPLPVGGYDLSRLQGDLLLRHSQGGEPFLGIGATETEPTDAGEVVYVDDGKVLTRRWNFRDCDQAKVTDDSKDIALFVEAPLPKVETRDVESLTRLIAERVQRYCGGQVSTGFLDVRDGRAVSL
jgi:DNA/RNA-binding domain of Phe-tRNA-synthetase-like protein